MPESEGGAYPWLAERAEMSPSAELVNGTEPASTYGAEADVVADSTQSMTDSGNDSGREPAVPFLQSLVDAMRKIAEQTREDAMAQLRASVAERSASIRSNTEQRAAELHEAANTDLAAVSAWEQGEIQRIRDEAATKVSARNATLEAQLAANVAAGEGAMAAVGARVDAFEAEMTSFFAQLNDIHDPAALASALKRIPHAPSLTDAGAASTGDTAPSPAAAAAAEPEATPAASTQPESEGGFPEVTSAVTAAAAPQATEPDNWVTESEAASDAAPAAPAAPAAVPVAATAVAEPTAEEAMVAEVAEAVVAEAVVAEAVVAEPAVAEPAVEEAVEEATTQVLVTGLTSFGAITSFKQSLERQAGILRVSLGLGTSGEFIFTAVHRAGFDVSSAIRSFEDSAQFVAANGQLRVTVGSKA
jgi:hypothetical protein